MFRASCLAMFWRRCGILCCLSTKHSRDWQNVVTSYSQITTRIRSRIWRSLILHQRRFVPLFASNFCAFRSICSSTNSLPSSEYIFQLDWAVIFIQIAYLMNRLRIETSTSGDPRCRCHKFLNRTNISWICFFVSFDIQEKKSWKR